MNQPNLLLAALPPVEYERVAPQLRLVPLEAGQVLYQADASITHAYFPLSGIISLVTSVEPSQVVETGVVGVDGFVGLPILYGVERDATSAVVQMTGDALRIDAGALYSLVSGVGAIRSAFLRYAHCYTLQVVQTAACNLVHRLQQRLIRWLLLVHDRIGGNEFYLTHEFLAQMLTVQRPSISLAAGILQEDGLIRYRRGQITVIDRQGLEQRVCPCYHLLRDRIARTLAT